MNEPGEQRLEIDDPIWSSAEALRSALGAEKLSAIELTESLAERASSLDRELNAIAATAFERARAEAKESERRLRSGEGVRPLEGIPFLAKDLFDTEGVETAYGSPMFAGNVPATDAEAVRLLRDAGAILLAKTSTDEFAYGITSCNPHLGAVANPWATDRVSGGSSGGSAAGVAAALAPIALGSDTGGSLRAPAALCGIVTLKPTYGRISCEGLFPMARSLDHVGPMARTPEDVGMLLPILDGRGGAGAAARLESLRVGVCPDLHTVEPAPAIARALDSTIATMAELGAEIVELGFPRADEFFPTFLSIQRAETVHTHRQAGLYPDRREGYGPDVRERLDVAAEVNIDEYLSAQANRASLKAEFSALLEAADVVLTPAHSAPPLPIDTPDVEEAMRQIVMDYTIPHDLLGIPACSLRVGFDDDGLPVGVQFAAADGADEKAIEAARWLFDATPEIQAVRPEIAVGK